MKSAKVLVVDDDKAIRESLKLVLSQHDFDVLDVPSGEAALSLLNSDIIDVIILDLMLPGLNGFETCRLIRAQSELPIIVLSAKDQTNDIVTALESGADDYLLKPFKAPELSARIRALLRRVGNKTKKSSNMIFSNLEIRPAEGSVYLNDKEVSLTKTEFNLLYELASKRGEVLSREELLQLVWGYDYFGDGRLVDVHIRRLRAKIDPDPANPKFIHTVRGFGYKFIG